MGFSSLKLVGQTNRQGITEHLLIPDLSPERIDGPLYNAVFLAAMWRIHRERPYVVASVDSVDKETPRKNDKLDSAYVASLPLLGMSGFAPKNPIAYVGQGDISPFIPMSRGRRLSFVSSKTARSHRTLLA